MERLFRMNLKRLIKGSTLSVVGYLLSPLSWWNDLFVNVPLALAFSWLISIFYAPAFYACFVVGYWLTNILGLILLQKGGEALLSKKTESYNRKRLIKDLSVSLVYTAAIVVLMKLRIIQPFPNYFVGK